MEGIESMFGIVDRIRAATSVNLRSLHGEKILRVEYIHSDPNWPTNYRLDPDMHEPDAAVRLTTSAGEFILAWEMYGEDELLTFSTTREVEERQVRFPAHRSDVSMVDPWPALMKLSVIDASIVENVWSDATIRIHFGLVEVDMSLGEWDVSGCRYIPNALLIEFLGAGDPLRR